MEKWNGIEEGSNDAIKSMRLTQNYSLRVFSYRQWRHNLYFGTTMKNEKWGKTANNDERWRTTANDGEKCRISANGESLAPLAGSRCKRPNWRLWEEGNHVTRSRESRDPGEKNREIKGDANGPIRGHRERRVANEEAEPTTGGAEPRIRENLKIFVEMRNRKNFSLMVAFLLYFFFQS